MFKVTKTSSIAGRLSLVFSLLNGVTIVLTVMGFTLIVLYFSYRSFKQELTAIAGLIATSSRAPLAFLDQQAGERVLSALEANSNVRYAVLLDQQNNIFSAFREYKLNFDSADLDLSYSQFSIYRKGEVVVIQPVILDSEQVGTVVISADMNSLLNQLAGIAIWCGVIFLVVVLVTTALSHKLKNWVSEPIDSLRQIAHKVSMTKDFSVRLETSSHDEIADLIRTFNFMIENIEERDKNLIAAKERAEKADQVKSAFLASMSHELRTPLHAIINITEELLDTKMTAEQTDMMQVVRNAGDSLLSIINDILDFSKIEASKMTLNSGPFDLESFMKRTVDMFRSLAGKKQIKLALEIDSSISKVINADAGRLSQVLVNLVGNAIKFTDNGGTISLQITRTEDRDDPDYSLLQFSVSDTGIGIPKDKLEYIFEAFSQITNLEKGRQGTGLGLAITARLVRLMGGKIWVNSILGQGSTFNFTIKCQELTDVVEDGLGVYDMKTPSLPENLLSLDQIAPDFEQSLSSEAQSAHSTVLIVEDNLVNQKLAQRLLHKKGIATLTAPNGQICVDLYKDRKVDLILMDINMPVMDGLEATRQIRSYEEGKKIKRVPIIAVTAGVSQEETKSCLEVGMDDYVLKPFRPKELIEKIERYISSTNSPAQSATAN